MAECMAPFSVKDKFNIYGKTKPVPCGKCPNCVRRRVAGWVFRMQQEVKVAESAYFITLTYNRNHVPITSCGNLDLDKTHLQKFFKRLRKAHSLDDERIPGKEKPAIRYYAVGEYGGESYRPHYHIILFNARLELIENAWRLDNKPIGRVHFGDVRGSSIAYCLKYISKESRVPAYDGDDRQKEFAIMSKGLGENYLTPAAKAWHKKKIQERGFLVAEDGEKVAMPRYYKEKLFTKEQKHAIGVFISLAADKALAEALMTSQGYFRNKMEADKAEYRKMYKNSKHGTKI